MAQLLVDLLTDGNVLVSVCVMCRDREVKVYAKLSPQNLQTLINSKARKTCKRNESINRIE